MDPRLRGDDDGGVCVGAHNTRHDDQATDMKKASPDDPGEAFFAISRMA
jgi:hypothetical protein